jgi:MFS family permease
LVDWFGPVAVVRAGALFSAAALAAALAINEAWAVVAGFALLGFGAAPAFPAVFQAAEHLPGVSPATGVAAVSLIGRGGFLIAPVIIGALADVASLRAALLVTVVAALLVAVVAPVLRGRPVGQSAPILPP